MSLANPKEIATQHSQPIATTTVKHLHILVLFLLACLFLFVAPLQLGSSGWETIDTSHWIGWVVVALITGMGLMMPFYQQRWNIAKSLLLATVAYILLTGIAAVLANDFNPAVRWEWCGLLAGLLFFLALHQMPGGDKREQQILWIILLSGFTQAILGYLQYHSISIAGYTFRPTAAVGGFYQVNNFSSYLATAALIPLLLHLPRRHRISVQAFLLLILMLSAYSLYLASSRTGLLGIVIGAVLILFGRWRGRHKPQAKTPVILSGWLWMIAIMAGYLLAHLLEDGSLVGKVAALGDPGGLNRRGMYEGTWNLFLEQPLFGHGLGTFTTNFQPAYVATMEQLGNSKIISSTTTYPHNELLYRLAESGLMGGLGLMLIAGATISIWWRLPEHRGWLYAGLLFPLLLHTQTEYPFYHSLLSWTLFLTILYLTSRHLVAHEKLVWSGTKASLAAMLLIFATTLASTVFLVDKMVRSMAMEQALITTQDTQNKPPIEYLQGLLHANLQDSYFAPPSRRLLMLQQVDWIQNRATIEEAKAWLELLHTAYRHFPTAPYYHMQVLALTTINKFDQAWALLEQAGRLYPRYKSQTERVVLQKWLVYIANQQPSTEAGEKYTPNKTVFSRYSNWLAQATLQGTPLSAQDYHFGIYSLKHMGEDDRARQLLELARAQHPEASVLQKWKL
ncbi:MAG: Wzy polymerase domain-containing protein [Gammaproteobacteria bacterium]|nr:Wzy polymerase domain-containing protein [Gammaproteobacteria bacterium]